MTLTPEMQAKLRERSKQLQEQLQSSRSNFSPRWDLGGQKALVQPGGDITFRYLPRWDSILPDGTMDLTNTGWWYFEAIEHWYDSPDGKSRHDWCPKTFGVDKPCPIHEDHAVLVESRDEQDQAKGRRVEGKGVWLWNAMRGVTGKRQLDENGLVDIRYVAHNVTLYDQFVIMINGGTNEDESATYACGDITHPETGYDIRLIRPAKRGVAWSATPAKKPSPLFLPGEEAAYVEWWNGMINLEDMVRSEMRTYDQMYAGYFGVPADQPAAPPSSPSLFMGRPPMGRPRR
jgi:gp32 DNA binding protein like